VAELYERFSEILDEARKGREPGRSPIAKDRDRVIHSGAFRRLQRKSQIVGVQSNDFFRTRLTHTLECAQIGRAIAGRALNTEGLDTVVEEPSDLPDLIEVACLAHDLGHPPFGHNGEEALQRMMRKHAEGLFEGNAQSMRIVTRLEPKVFREKPLGLDLCATTLKAIVKYPCSEKRPQGTAEHPKFCFYVNDDDMAIAKWLYGDLDTAERTLAAEMLEAADDIAYAAHDFEDGVWSGMIPLWELHQGIGDARERLARRLTERGDGEVNADQTLEDLLAPVKDDPWLMQPFSRARPHRSQLTNFCARLIGEFIEEVTPDGRFTKPLPDRVARRIAVLKAMAWEWMIEDPAQETVRFGQRRLVEDMFEGFWANPMMLPSSTTDWLPLKEESRANPLDRVVWTEKARLICDHVAGMTDLYALHVHSEMFAGGGAPNLRLI
jgi:dGTPase